MLVVESIKMPNVKKLSIDQLVDLARTYDLLTSDIEKIIITKQLINLLKIAMIKNFRKSINMKI